MERQNQRTLEVLETQMPEFSEEDKDKSYPCQPYRTPEVFLVGTAIDLMAGYSNGSNLEHQGQYYFF